MKFTHLHVHSHYSLLDGLPKIDELLDYVKELGMDSVALTDHGVLYGAVEFYKKAKDRGIKPIIGSEIYLAFERMSQERPNIDDKRYHLVLLVKNEEGYKNLVKLLTKAHLEGFYYKPRVDEELLAKHSRGLICLSACLAGKIPKMILAKKMGEAEKVALKYQKIFGKDNFYLEIQHHPNSRDQNFVNPGLISLSKKLGIPLVATNDVHYLRPEDAEAQDVLMLINTGSDPNDPERLTLKEDDFSLRSPEKIIKDFRDLPEAIESTQKIAELCNFQFELGKVELPQFKVPSGKSQDEYLEELCYQGLKKRYDAHPKKEILDRLNHELSVIKQTGFASYFLIVQDFVNWAKENRIVVGPGRGSVGGSLVAYLLNITNIDPLKYNLLFERFMTPERTSYPDIDLDFTDLRRDEVINYVAHKYGQDRVSQIITFGTMAARAVIRDVGRALSYTYSYCDQLAKMIPMYSTLDQTLATVNEFREAYLKDPQARKLIDFARKLEGVARHASTHACGVVISSQPLENQIPLQHPTQDDEVIVTQYEMRSIEDLGLLKMDFLGLKNLTIIENTVNLIKKRHNQEIDIENLPLDDEKTYKLLQNGETTSVFQLESSGMKRYLKELKPTEIEDIIAMVALFRPGPMELIPEYIKRKHKKGRVEYLHPKLKPILESTYGLPVYQEQLMQIAQKLAGFTSAEADVLRKAVGKKIRSLLMSQKEKFIEGAIKNRIKKEIAQKIWEWILPFARYGFNKCLTGDTQIPSLTGTIRTIEETYKKHTLKSLDDKSVVSLDKNKKLKFGEIEDIKKNGIKPVYEITTTSGRKIQATKEHRFLVFNGWKKLEELKGGERIATWRGWPVQKCRQVNWPFHKSALLGYVLSEGNTCHPHSFYFYTNSKEELQEYIKILKKFKNTKPTVSQREGRRGRYEVYAGRINLKEKSEAVEWIMNELKLRDKKATQKFFPKAVFGLSEAQLGILLGKIWSGDGHIDLKTQNLFYATSSEKLARGLQDLLLRFRILGRLHYKEFNYRQTKKPGWAVYISRYDNISKFYKNIGPYLIKSERKKLEILINAHSILKAPQELYARGTADTVPAPVLGILRNNCQERNLAMKTVARLAGISWRLFMYDPRKEGFQRETIQKIATALNSEELQNHANSDILWDRIKNIKFIGKKQTYDLTISENHNFIANGFIVHNSHSACYATIAYQTAFLKAHYPSGFMAAVLNSEKADIERIGFLIDECKRMGIKVLPPEINESEENFTQVGENIIRFGLSAIKNVGSNVVRAIVKERLQLTHYPRLSSNQPETGGGFQSIEDFVTRVSSKDLNKKSLESLIKAGVFDQIAERNQLLFNLERLLEWSREIQRVKAEGQRGLFDGMKFTTQFQLSPAPPATKPEKLAWEKELLGLFVTSHPLEDFKKILDKRTLSITKISASLPGRKIKIGGIISKIKKIITRSGRPMLFLNLEDLTDKIEVVIFPGIIERDPSIFQENKIVLILGRVDNRDGVPKIIAEDIEEITDNH